MALSDTACLNFTYYVSSCENYKKGFFKKYFSNAKLQRLYFTFHTGWVTTGKFYLSDLLFVPYKDR